MNSSQLKVGRIDYLNIWPLFQCINDNLCRDISFASGHPAMLNQALARKEIHVSPSSSIEYLYRGEDYLLLPDLSISAASQVQSVIFCLPFPFDELERYAGQNGEIFLTRASDTSRALLKILWHYHWKLPSPRWRMLDPGQGLSTGKPFLEIGDHALSIFLHPQQNMHILDLAGEWNKMTGLPFVFALWILRRDLQGRQRSVLARLARELLQARRAMPGRYHELSMLYPGTEFTPEQISAYWQKMDYGLEQDHKAALAAFGRYLSDMGEISGMPALDFFEG